MSCENEQQLISSLLDRRIAGPERENALAHIVSCQTCETAYESMQKMRLSLGKLNAAPVPAELRASLRDMAASERLRRISLTTQKTRTARWSDTVHLWFENLMRPMALPFAGGVLSALFLFAAWVPSMAAPRISGDVPTPIMTAPSLDRFQFSPTDKGGNAVVTLLIDPRGKVMDCQVTGGELSPELINMILFYQYTPAKVLGHDTWGTLVFRMNEINVKG